jgi:hypothetical protein
MRERSVYDHLPDFIIKDLVELEGTEGKKEE